jgi:hypothetical protein
MGKEGQTVVIVCEAGCERINPKPLKGSMGVFK